MTTTDGLRFAVFPDGTTASESAVLSSVPLPDWARWLKVTRRRSDGRTQFFVSSDDGEVEPSAWSQLGVDGFAAAGAAMHTATSSAYLEIGSRFAGVTEATAGFVRRFILRNGIDGSTVADFVASSCSQTGYTDPLGNAWIALRSASGRQTVVQSPVAATATSVIVHDGTDDNIITPLASAPALNSSNAFSVSTVWRAFGTHGNFSRSWGNRGGGGATKGVELSFDTGGTNLLKVYSADGAVGASPPGVAWPAGVRVVHTGTSDGSALRQFVNTVASPSTPPRVDVSTANTPTIGSSTAPSAFMFMQFQALITREAEMTDVEQGLVTAYYRGGL